MFLLRTFVAVIALLLVAACASDEEKAEQHFQSAKALFEAGDVDRAIVELRNVFANDEGHPEAHLLFAQVQRDRGRYRRSMSSFRRVAEEFPDNLEALLGLSELSAFLQIWEDAERYGRAAAEIDPENPDAKVISAVLDYRQSLLDQDAARRGEVLSAAEGLLEERPNSVILRNIFVDGYAWQGDYQRALEQVDFAIAVSPRHKPLHYSKMGILGEIGDESLIETQLRVMATEFPDDEDVQAALIRFLLSTGDVEAAEAFFRSIADPEGEEVGLYVAFVRFINETRGRDAAMEEIRSTLDVVSDRGTMRSILAGMMFDSGQTAEAIAEMEDILASDDGLFIENQVRLALAEMQIADGNEVGARRRVEEVLETDSRNIEAVRLQANWLIESDQTDEAIASLRAALSENEDHVGALVMLARAHSRAGNRSLARDTLAQAVAASGNATEPSLQYAQILLNEGRIRPAEQVLVDSLRVFPDSLEVLNDLGNLYVQTGDFSRAEGVRRRLEEIGTEPAIQLAERLNLALLSAQQRTDEFIAALEGMAAGDSSNDQATVALIRARLNNGEPDEALRLAEEAAAKNPEKMGLAMVLAATRAATGDLEGAIAGYETLTGEDGATPQVWQALTQALLAAGRRDDAVAAMGDGLAMFPDDLQLLWMRASYLEGEGDIDGAIDIYETMYAINSNLPVIANNLASLIATWRADDAEAVDRAFEIARRLSGIEVPAFQDTLGWILHLRGDSEQAVRSLEPAAEGLPNDPIVQYHLAMAYLGAGRTEEAALQFRRVIEVAVPGSELPQVQAAKSELDRLAAMSDPEDTDAN